MYNILFKSWTKNVINSCILKQKCFKKEYNSKRKMHTIDCLIVCLLAWWMGWDVRGGRERGDGIGWDGREGGEGGNWIGWDAMGWDEWW